MPPRTIILAPDSFKETLPAVDVAAAMARGIRRTSSTVEIDQCPVGDGGEGTLEALMTACYGQWRRLLVHGPLSELVEARYGIIESCAGRSVAVIEMAEASGLARVPPGGRDPLRATSLGTGEMIRHAADGGCREIIVAIGGSATVDGGTGMAQACGWRFFDADDAEIEAPMCGGLLRNVKRCQRPFRDFPPIRVACDVTNPLCGPEGAARVYGPQKGATPEQVESLDAGLAHLAAITGGDPNTAGAGAAGGAGYGLRTFLGATLERGIDLVLEAVRFRERCAAAGLVITGEGRLDDQSLQGKACLGVAAAAAALGVPTIAIVGSTGPGADRCVGPGMLHSYYSLEERFGREHARHNTQALLADVAEQVVRTFVC